jgi:hypothetical protein
MSGLPKGNNIMNVPKDTLQISKIAAAQRQLDAAIRMFFDQEDELAIHTVAAAAFQVLRDVTKKRGRHFTLEVFRTGIWVIAKQYADGTLPPDKLAMFKQSAIMALIEPLIPDIRDQGDKFDRQRIGVGISERHARKIWRTQATNFLKHADRDPDDSLSGDDLDNEFILMAACAAYVELAGRPTPEIAAYFAFWAAKNHEVEGLAGEVQQFARTLETANEGRKYKLCVRYIRENKTLKRRP